MGEADARVHAGVGPDQGSAQDQHIQGARLRGGAAGHQWGGEGWVRAQGACGKEALGGPPVLF